MKKRMGSCFVILIFIAGISIWRRTEEVKKEVFLQKGRTLPMTHEGKEEPASIYMPPAFAYEEIRSLYHLDYMDVEDLSHNEIEFVSDKTYEVIKTAYKEMNFFGEIEKGDKESYKFYIEKFQLLLEEKVKFILSEEVKDTYREETQYYLSEYEDLKGDVKKEKFVPEDYLYFFFDMNGDDKPELCIKKENGVRVICIFQYQEETDEILLWHKLSNGYYRLIGTKKGGFVHYTMDGDFHGYYELEEDGKQRFEVLFYCLYKTETGEFVKVYMVGLPEYSDGNKNYKIRESIEENPYIKSSSRGKLYRITKEQYEELTNDYFRAIELEGENLKEVTYTYEELFGKEL